ncbi:MAG: trypsin-like serine protease [Phycisphaeraceae bacterium]|nr:trypsin-like serine protease [Phycisphaeraceae bacterium]
MNTLCIKLWIFGCRSIHVILRPIRLMAPVASVVLPLSLINPVEAIVTSDFAGTHVVTPGSLAAGFTLDGVAKIETYDEDLPEVIISEGAATLLLGGKSVLTAAHLFDYSVYIGDIDLTWELPGGNVNFTVSISQVDTHLRYTDAIHGYDVALIHLTPAQQDAVQGVPAYPVGIRNMNVFQQQFVVVGYGEGGHGSSGSDFLSFPYGTKRYGLNRYDDNAPAVAGVTNTHVQLGLDFDNGNAGNDFFGLFYGIADTGYGNDEVGLAYGDSGGPTFTALGEIVGVHSYTNSFLGGPQRSDVDTNKNHSWGEYAVDANVTHQAIYDWIDILVYNKIHLRQLLTSGPTSMDWDDDETWAYGGSPQNDETAYLDTWHDSSVTIAGPGSINGPSTVTNIAGLFVGTGPGVKVLDIAYGAEFNVAGDATIDTNGAVYLPRGAFTADRLIVQGTTAAPGPPVPEAGLFVWTDYYELGSSSLTVNSIEVGPGGDFVHDWLNPATGLLSADELNISGGGRAFFQWDASGITHVTNDGLLSMGEYVEGNSLAVNTFTQTEYGQTLLFIGEYPAPGSGDMIADSIAASGAVSLDGQLVFILADGYTPSLYESDTLLTGSAITGIFTNVIRSDLEGYEYSIIVNSNLALAVTYGATTVTLTAAIPGDANLDHAVNLADL